MDDNFATNLLRGIMAAATAQLALSVSREMFGRGYYSLGAQEKAAVDQTVLSQVAGNFHALTPEFFAQPATPPVGFGTVHPSPIPRDSPKTD
jgi:hypothetical protein